MITTGTRVISFAGTRLAVGWEGETSLAVLKALYLTQSVPAPDSYVSPHFRLRNAEPDGPISLYRADRLLYQGYSEGAAAAVLLDCTVHDLVDGCRIGPVFHAAAVSCCGRGLLLPGISGSGKTTLVAWLASKGWDYLTDEIACIEQGSWEIQAFYRSLYIRTPIAASLEQLVPEAVKSLDSVNGIGIFRSAQGVIVPVRHIRPNNTYRTPEVQLIVFPQYLSSADGEFMRLSQAQACARLMGCALNIRNLPGHGLDEISRLARQIPAYTLTYGRLDRLADMIAGLLDNHFPFSQA